MMNFYEVLRSTKEIEVRNGNEDSDILDNQSIDDFLRMIAADGVWGNEGSIVALSLAVEAKLLLFLVYGISQQLRLIIEAKPMTTKSVKILTIIYTDKTHFYVSRLKYDTDINQYIKINRKEMNNLTHIEYSINKLYQTNLSEYNRIIKNKQ